tara:strand:+ start:1293 stop:1676 length:384 start_codon:yes stop_codon:yes gene_type:complete
MEDISILKKEDFEFFDKKVFKDRGKTFNKLLYSPQNTVLIFDRGIVIFEIYDEDDTNGYNFDRVCMLYLLYKAKDSKIDWKVAYNEFIKFLKFNKCTKMLMYTKINPNFWIDNYKFKLKRYEMELDL